jgi:hypothetical protein
VNSIVIFKRMCNHTYEFIRFISITQALKNVETHIKKKKVGGIKGGVNVTM